MRVKCACACHVPAVAVTVREGVVSVVEVASPGGHPRDGVAALVVIVAAVVHPG